MSLLHYLIAAVLITSVTKKNVTTNIKDFKNVGVIENTFAHTAGSMVVINDGSWILTCTHVFKDINGNIAPLNNFLVSLGEYSGEVEEIYPHPTADIALCKLKKGTGLTGSTLSRKVLGKDTEIWLTGYGFGGEIVGDESVKYNQHFGNFGVCTNKIDDIFTLNKSIVALYSVSVNKNSTEHEGIIGFGDSGGGVFIYNNDKIELVGISMAISGEFISETTILSPQGLFIPINGLYTWINDTIRKNSPPVDFY